MSELNSFTAGIEKISDQTITNTNEIEIIKDAIDGLDINNRLNILESKLETSLNVTEQLVNSSNNLLATAESRIDTTLATADSVLASAEFISSTFLIFIGLAITVAGIAISWHLGKKQTDHVKEAVDKITDRLNKDEDFKSDFIRVLVSHDSLRENISHAIDQAANSIKKQHFSSSEARDLKDELDFSSENK